MFADFLLEKLQEYEREKGRRVSLVEYANYLGVKRPILSMWMLGKTDPSLESARNLATILGPEVYTVLELIKPDPLLEYVTRNWDQLSPEMQQQISEKIDEYLVQKKITPKGYSENHP